MTWRYTKAGKGYSRPDPEDGIRVEGPLVLDDWKNIVTDILDVLAEQAKKEDDS